MFYIFLVLFIVILGQIKIRVKNVNIVDLLIVIIMSFVFGLRYDVGRDYLSYQADYNGTLEWNTKKEFIYDSFQKIFHFLHLPFWVFNLVIGLTLFFVLYKISKDLKIDYYKLILAFILTGILFMFFNISRQLVAAVIVFYAYKYINMKKPVKYVIFIIIAGLIHMTAFLFLPFYFIKDLKLNMVLFLVFLFVGFILYISNFVDIIYKFMDFMPFKYSSYLGSHYDQEVSFGIGLIFYILVAFILSINGIEEKNKIYMFYLTYAIGYSLLLFTLKSFIVERIVDGYFYTGIIFILPNILKRPFKSKEIAMFNIMLGLGFVILFIYSIINIYHGNTEKLLYKTIFQK